MITIRVITIKMPVYISVIIYLYILLPYNCFFQDLHWHESCFQCAKCSVSLLHQSFAATARNILCSGCYDQVFRSEWVTKFLRTESFTEDHSRMRNFSLKFEIKCKLCRSRIVITRSTMLSEMLGEHIIESLEN